METHQPPAETPAARTGEVLRVAAAVKHVALALALLASAVLFIDYRNAGDPAFCGVASGCFAVRMSSYSRLGPIPLPDLALPAFAFLFVASLFARKVEHHRIVAGAAVLGGLAAIALIAVQAVAIGTFCPWCVIVDSSAIVAAIAAATIAVLVGDREDRAASASASPASAGAWAVAAALAAGLPFVWARYPAVPPPPPAIAAEQEAGKVTIVSFTDFECPFCRKLHPTVEALIEKHAGKVRLVRKMKPLSGHPGALPAAKAYLCAPPAARDRVADHLYHAEPRELNDAAMARLPQALDVGDPAAFRECLGAKATTEALERDAKLFEELGGRGLPYTWVGGHVILGANEPRLIEAVEDDLGGPRPALPVAALFVVVGVALAAAAAVSLRAGGSARGPAVPS